MPVADLAALSAQFLDDLSADHDPLTVKQYGYYLGQAPFRAVEDLSTANIHDWLRAQLKVVCAKTVKKKKSCVRQLCLWLEEHGHIDEVPEIAPLPARATGVRDTKKRHKLHSIPLTMDQAGAWVAAMPEWAWPGRDRGRRFRVRARYAVALMTALRPATLDEIRCPEDYHRGASELRIRDEIDKARFGRVLTLDTVSRATLDGVCPDVGLVFGRHRALVAIRRAAIAALPPDIARQVTPYDLRHARLTWMLEHSKNLSGVAYQSGHKRIDTLAAFYVHPSRRAQESVLRDCEAARQLSLFPDDDTTE